MQDKKKFIQVEEIASALSVPRHFMGKILKRMAKEKVLSSVKGPCGGFTINENTLGTTLVQLAKLTDGTLSLDSCVMQWKECNTTDPCALHCKMEGLRSGLKTLLSETTVGDLLITSRADFLEAIF